MSRVNRTIVFIGLLSLFSVICAYAQTPSGLPNTPPSGNLPDASAATTGGRTTSGVGTGNANPPASSPAETPKPAAAGDKPSSTDTPAGKSEPSSTEGEGANA